MSFVRKSFAPRAGAGTEITPDKVLDNYYGFNRLLELKQGAMGDSQWNAGDSDVRSGKKYGKTGGVTGTGTLVEGGEYATDSSGKGTGFASDETMTSYVKFHKVKCHHKTGTVSVSFTFTKGDGTVYVRVTEDDVVVVAEEHLTSNQTWSRTFTTSKAFSEVAIESRHDSTYDTTYCKHTNPSITFPA
jgi:hypothetical protein